MVPFSKTANSAAKIIKKHYKKLQNDDEFDVFDFDVITAYSRHKNINQAQARAKLALLNVEKVNVKHAKSLWNAKILPAKPPTKDTFSITSEINCDSENLIYLYTCYICQIQY